ncbi:MULTISPECIES: hypothetical protein [Providencia]|uniref:hypothetical protein n=1 Tax=Providencia TaxID=586 RepID=UPI00234A1A31|nr:hypothetical protein [Providencia sp. PROV239]
MAMKLEVIITHDETNNKCSVEWTTASTQQVTRQEEQTLSLVKKGIVTSTGLPSGTHCYPLT